MPAKDPERRRATRRAWYHRTKSTERQQRRRREARRRRNRRNLEWVEALKASSKCERCGESHPACLQFHHRDRREKTFCISDALRRGWTLPRIRREVAKCHVLCGNCHFKLHAKEITRPELLPRVRGSRVLVLWRRVVDALDKKPAANSVAELVPEEWLEEKELAAKKKG